MAFSGSGAISGAGSGAAIGTSILPGWGTAIGAIGGGLLGAFGGSDESSDAAYNLSDKQYAQSKEFAKNGIQWRVADAKKAGIHPLYSLGASTTTPTMTGGGQSMARDGQDMSRALAATADRFTRTKTTSKGALYALQIERAGLENDLLRSRIARENSAQLGPGLPSTTPGLIDGQGDSPRITNIKQQRVIRSSQNPSQEPGAITDTGFAKTATGWAPIPSSDVKDRIEDQLVPELAWAFRNLLLPNLGKGLPPPDNFKSRGSKWGWVASRQEWQEKYPGRRKPIRYRQRKRRPDPRPLRNLRRK